MKLLDRNDIADNLRSGYDFLEELYLYFITDHDIHVDIMNKYIYYMNKKFGMYEDRIEETDKNTLDENHNICMYHASNFIDLIYGIDESPKNKRLVVAFYEKIMHLRDEYAGYEICYGDTMDDWDDICEFSVFCYEQSTFGLNPPINSVTILLPEKIYFSVLNNFKYV
jgi:hypothetical protein